jgi:long-chain acyl-CoA synthetase
VAAADHALIMSALPARFQQNLAIAMDGELLESWLHPPKAMPLLTRLRLFTMYVLAVSVFNVFPLPRKSGFRQSFVYAGEAVDRGYSLLVFPEGRRTDDGLMHKFQSGIGILATKLDVDVVPVRIEGLYEMKTARRYFARSGEVSVTFGEPVRFEKERNAADIAAELERRVRSLGKES